MNASHIIQELDPNFAGTHVFDNMPHKATVSKSCNLVADAIDSFRSDMLSQARGSTFHGLGLETDESVPFGNKWMGYRFQITLFHIPLIRPLHQWEDAKYNKALPVDVHSVLADICHAPTKDGRGLVAILEKQLRGFGCNFADVLSGSTDGGGENTGKEGMHAHFETLGQGYVKRRGLEHISWRVCDAGIAAAGRL